MAETTAMSSTVFWDVIRRPIRFRDTLVATAHLLPCTFIDVSPGGSLCTFLKYHYRAGTNYTGFSVISPFRIDVSSLAKIVDHFRAR